ncbi:hypothetical protein [Candidatus Oleimmundimicrobium sp.]|uniref:hypothetical protein n=1 Tax=Candidatus Oleimmundimicrobium sp. TaxID=3060597 RepID=UPI00271990A8|nr:hypothetical protein [Candidatus Oleimmundimicrobium sp.]MDO8885968.1 hypothetical protein [Candidatus Oleimmundimicrobium sp.]
MSDIEMNLPFPLDDNGYFRRECPFCCKEFKVLLEKEELTDLAQKGLDSFMVETQEATNLDEDEHSEVEFTCPYCGQAAVSGNWWTQEQLAYISVVTKNIMAKIVNENLIRPLKRTSRKYGSGMISVQFEGKEMEQQEPWISPEVNDMKVYDLPCCQRKIKVEDGWASRVFCFFCGFPH